MYHLLYLFCLMTKNEERDAITRGDIDLGILLFGRTYFAVYYRVSFLFLMLTTMHQTSSMPFVAFAITCCCSWDISLAFTQVLREVGSSSV